MLPVFKSSVERMMDTRVQAAFLLEREGRGVGWATQLGLCTGRKNSLSGSSKEKKTVVVRSHAISAAIAASSCPFMTPRGFHVLRVFFLSSRLPQRLCSFRNATSTVKPASSYRNFDEEEL